MCIRYPPYFCSEFLQNYIATFASSGWNITNKSMLNEIYPGDVEEKNYLPLFHIKDLFFSP